MASGRVTVRSWPSTWCQPHRAAPTAPPASPAAGWIQRSSKGPSRRRRPLATQLRATPPARHRPALAGQARRGAGHPQDDLLGHLLDRPGQVHLPAGEVRLGRPRRAAEHVVEAAVGHAQRGQVAEVLPVDRERAVVVEVDQVVEDGVHVAGLAVGGEAHQLVLAGVDPEAAVVGERGVEQAEGVREVELADHLDLMAPPHPDARGGPLPHPVEGQDRRGLERRGEEGRSGVALVVLGVPEVPGSLVAQGGQLGLDALADPQLLAQPDRHRPVERGEPLRRGAEVGAQEPDEVVSGFS